MKALLAALLGLTPLPPVLVAQADAYAPARFNWTTVNVAVLPDTLAGVSVWIFSSRTYDPSHHIQYGGTFEPKDVPSWARRADSLLADSLPIADTAKWMSAPTIVSSTGGLLGWQRIHKKGQWQNRALLAFYPAPVSHGAEREPVELDLSLPDAREFLDSMVSKAAVSRFVPDTTRFGLADIAHVQSKPEVISGPPPRYPQSLRDNGIQGTVWIQVIVDTAGHPEPHTLRVLMSDDPGFEQEATRAILGTRFKPARVDGKPVRVLVVIPVNFTLGHP
ncbi:MAG TPA: energy transducer TonB [Gemmatimonadales bacterium]|nr:energy transducer TonB [Gemmatimonadales bacterium]